MKEVQKMRRRKITSFRSLFLLTRTCMCKSGGRKGIFTRKAKAKLVDPREMKG